MVLKDTKYTTRQLTEAIRMERFEDIYEKFYKGSLGCEGAASFLGCSVRHFHRLRARYEENGLQDLADKRVGKTSPHKAADEEIELVTRLYKEKYRDFSVAHFHEFLATKHQFLRSYSWLKNILTEARLIAPSKRGGPHRLRRPRSPMCGMMIHQDGSTHEWVPGKMWDLIVTLDDATSEIYSAFFVQEEGTKSSFAGVRDVIEKRGLFCSFYSDRGSHYFYTPEAGGKVDKSRPTQFGRALKQLNINHIAAYSPQARGRSERMFGTLQGRLPQEFALEGITDMAAANVYLRDIYLPRHNAKFMVEASSEKSSFMPSLGINVAEILCIQEDRVVRCDNCVSYNGKILQIHGSEYRHHFVKSRVQIHEYCDGGLAIFYGNLCIGRYDSAGKFLDDVAVKKEGRMNDIAA